MVPSMEPSFITIAQAAERTGKSPSTIRRLIHAITEADNHGDRAMIEPTPKQVATFKKKDENFTWKIREDLVESNFHGALRVEKKVVSKHSTDILTILEKELELKNKQIEKQWEVIHALNDRLREGNILMGSLQKRLGPPVETPQETMVEASAAQPSTNASVEKPRRKWWTFRR